MAEQKDKVIVTPGLHCQGMQHCHGESLQPRAEAAAESDHDAGPGQQEPWQMQKLRPSRAAPSRRGLPQRVTETSTSYTGEH
jgi:hypothetical protein